MTESNAERMPVPEAAQELERHLRARRHAVNGLVALDGEDRWGHPGPERQEEMAREAGLLQAHLRQAEQQLAERVAQLRADDPAALESWIVAQETLLDAYLGVLAAHPDPDRVRTEISVAQGERKGWGRVRAGKIAFVEQNSFYVRPPREVYVSLFGAEP